MYKDFSEMFAAAKAGKRRTVSVAAAAEEHIIRLVTEIKKEDLCDIVLVDDEGKIREIAERLGESLTGVSVIHEPGPDKVALHAVSLVSAGKADVLIKGNINPGDFCRAILDKERGLRTGRRLSALTCYDVPSMKKLFFMGFALLLCAMWPADAAAQLKIGGRKLNTGKLLEAGKDVAKAVTLSDKDIADLSREAVEWMDANNPIADETTEYGARLKRLTEGITEINGLPLNFKVYHVVDVNAFDCGEGLIRLL